MYFKCKNCGGNTIYSPEKQTCVCPFCESEKSQEREEGSSQSISVCPNCGGEIELEEHTSATKCPYCDTYLILNSRVEGEYAPKMVIPFQMGKETCKKKLREHFKKNLFAPSDFLSEAKLNKMLGIYVPYWFFGYDTDCCFTGEGTKVRTWVSGNTEYTETSYYAINREMDIAFEKIPVDASEKMPDDVMDLMEPFDYKKMTNFDPMFLSGFYGEKYNMLAESVEGRAKAKMREDAENLLKQSYSGYHTVRPQRQDIKVKASNHFYGLLPIWEYRYTYAGKEYPFYVNGQTGKIVGSAPVSKPKMWGYAATYFACSMTILVLISMLIGF